MDLDSTFDELDADELSSSGRSTPVQDERKQCDDGRDDDHRHPALEPGLTSKPPIPPTGPPAGQHVQQDVTSFHVEPKNSVTFDDAIELKFQRWFPNSAPTTAAAAALSFVDVPPLNGMSYEYSERVIDNDKGTITYTRSSSSMSIRGSQDQLDEEHLYSNLSAAIGAGGTGDKLKSAVSVDLSEILQNDGNRRTPPSSSSAKSKKKNHKRTVPVALKAKRAEAPRLSLKPKPPVTVVRTGSNAEATARNEPSPENGTKKDRPRKVDDSPTVDYVKEDVVSWMSSHQQRSPTPEFNDVSVSGDFFFFFCKKTNTFAKIVRYVVMYLIWKKNSRFEEEKGIKKRFQGKRDNFFSTKYMKRGNISNNKHI